MIRSVVRALDAPLRGLAARPWAGATLVGILWALISTVFFACMHASVRHVSSGMHPFEIAFFRNFFGFCVFVPWVVATGLSAFRTERFPAHLARGVINSGSMLTWFWALSLLPLAEATALGLTGPLFVTLAAIVVLGERVRVPRWFAIGLGAAGTLVILRPGVVEVSLGALLVLASSVFVAASKIITKDLSRTDDSATIVAYLALLMTPITLVPAIFFWQWPTWEQLVWLAVIGTLGSTAHYCFVRSYKHIDVTLAEPIVPVRLVWSAMIGFFAFGEVPDWGLWVGGAMIVAATTYIAHHEARQKKLPAPAE
jgi:drug/metabolite transporter (DMT)-like permease